MVKAPLQRSCPSSARVAATVAAVALITLWMVVRSPVPAPVTFRSTSASPVPPAALSPDACTPPPALSPGPASRRCLGCAGFAELTARPLDLSTPAPHFVPSNCPLFAFSRAAGRSCLASRRVFIFGNSIARGFEFELQAMLSDVEAEASSRLDQKIACGSVEHRQGKPCSLALGGDGGPELRFSYLQLFADFTPGLPPGAHSDQCGADGFANVSACLENRLALARDGDLLIFHLGLMYAIHRDEVLAVQPALDYKAWLRASMVRWREAVAHAWRGRTEDVFRIRLANLLPFDARQASAIAYLPSINQLSDEVFNGTGWGVVDQWSINRGNEKAYQDHVHFQGPLSRVTWHVILSSLCGNPALLPPPNESVWGAN